MPQIKIFVEKRRDKNGNLISSNVPLKMTFGRIWNGTIGERIDISNWDHKKQRVKKNQSGSIEINALLQMTGEKVQRAYRDLLLSGVTPTPELMKEKIHGTRKLNDNKPTNILVAFDNYITLKTTIGNRTFWAHLPSTKKYLTEYIGNRLITFNDIDINLLEGFATFLSAKNLTINTVASHLKRVRIFLNHAAKNGDNISMKYKAYKSKESETEIFFLTISELKMIQRVKLKNNLSVVRDCFIVGCHTGLRHSDLHRLRKDEIKNGFIRYRSVKTKDIHSIPLTTTAETIFNKYNSTESEFALPMISNQKMNDALKIIAEIAGLNEMVTIVKYIGTNRIEQSFMKCDLITSHWMRKTFISNSLILGIPQEQVMALSNHKSYNSFKKYFKVRDHEKSKAMLKWENA